MIVSGSGRCWCAVGWNAVETETERSVGIDPLPAADPS